jgi:hypothetical protein
MQFNVWAGVFPNFTALAPETLVSLTTEALPASVPFSVSAATPVPEAAKLLYIR